MTHILKNIANLTQNDVNELSIHLVMIIIGVIESSIVHNKRYISVFHDKRSTTGFDFIEK